MKTTLIPVPPAGGSLSSGPTGNQWLRCSRPIASNE
uniref:Uncharacterized protein n=1 Tax=Anguilla anguilla TaxID=7936 RepID=A0A0E9TN54_ANGAN